MKKIISMITCLIILTCMLVVPEPIEVEAAEDKNYNYYFEYLCCDNGNSYSYYNLEFSVDKKICGYKNLTNNGYRVELCLYAYDDAGVIDLHADLGFLKTYLNYSFIKDYIKQGTCKYEGNREFSFSSVSYEGVSGSIMNTKTWGTDFDENGFLSTNIPYFSSKEECMAYINGEIDEKSAINYESDLTDIIYDLEVPQDMKLTCDDGMFSLPIYTMKWKQNDPNYQNWTTEVYVYVSMDAWEGALGIHLWGDSYTYEDMYLMGESFSTYKLKYVIDVDSDKYEKAEEAILDYIFNDNPKLSGSAVDYYKVYMRNYYNDGTYRHYSNWLLIEFDYEFESGQGVTSVIEMNGSVKDNPGATKPELDFVGDIVGDSQYTGEIDGNLEESSGDILSWIKNGFGIGGDSGVIAMISDTFDFIPNEMWAVMMSGIALMVGVAVFKFIRG